MNIKKFLSVIVAIFITVSALPVCFAENALPESPHNYPDNYSNVWKYNYDGEAKGLLVTFSEDTYVEDYKGLIFFGDKISGSEITAGDFKNIIAPLKHGDYIAISDADNNTIGSYSGDELAGKTVFVPGTTVNIRLSTDSSVNYYGFRVTDISPCPDEDAAIITYSDGESVLGTTCCYKTGCFEVKNPLSYLTAEEKTVYPGWTSNTGGAVEYEKGGEAPFPGKDITLYPVKCKVALAPDEVFYFSNSSYYFEAEELTGYYMTAEDYRNMELNLYKTYGLGPMPSVVLSVVLATLPNWEWQGSCYGISTVTALQHFGIIDVLSLQDAECMNDMEPDEELISFINYYQSQAATSYVTENKALIKGSVSYRNELREMFRSAESGNIVMFTEYDGNVFVTPAHTVLITGAYTAADGTHKLIIYDCNRPSSYYYGNYSTTISISEDFSTLSFYGDEIGAFNWTDDFSQFESFSIKGDGNILSWYISFFNHIKTFFTHVLNALKNMF